MRISTPRARFVGISLVLLVIAAGPPTDALAAAAHPQAKLAFEVKAGHGYRMTGESLNATATLTLTRSGPHAKAGALSSYIARQRAGAGAISARFGALGSISMRFHPTGQVRHSRPAGGCRGPDRFTIREGFLVGSLSFRGEGGYTSKRAHRVRARSISPPRLRCEGPAVAVTSASRRRLPVYDFEAGFRSGPLHEYFFASTDRRHPSLFYASIEEVEGSVAIHRVALVTSRPRTFDTDNALSFATVKPPPPFSGSGELTRRPSGARAWSGSLAVSFPGAPNVPLAADARFKTRLTRTW